MKSRARFADECRGRRSEVFPRRPGTPSVGQNVRVSVVREYREGSRAVGTTPALPRVYFVPRGGQLVRVVAELRDDLCELRSELELLRRIHRRLAAPPTPQLSASPRSRNLDELLQILRDARHAVVEEMVELLDREFPDVRGEVAMTVINEEAENIVQEAVDSGVVDAVGVLNAATAGDAANGSLAGATLQAATALVGETSGSEIQVEPGMTSAETAAQIEAALAGVVGIPATDRADAFAAAGEKAATPADSVVPAESDEERVVSGVNGAGDGDHGASTSLEALDAALASNGESMEGGLSASTTPEEIRAEAEVAQSGSDAAMNPPRDSDSNPVDAIAESKPAASVGAAAIGPSEPRSGPSRQLNSPSSPETLFTPERAERAVAEIEQGVRKLATLLSTEVNEQWQRASGTLDQLVHAREEAVTLAASARASLDAILQLRADAQTARDDAELVRREARELREETLRAKQRAEAAAHVAEIAADQASKERVEFHRGGAMVTQTLP